VARRPDTPSARASPGKASLDIFWLKDDSSHILDDLPAPNVLAQEIVEHLEAAPASFREVAAALPRSRETR
jgi:type I restriction enzyme M protein